MQWYVVTQIRFSLSLPSSCVLIPHFFKTAFKLDKRYSSPSACVHQLALKYHVLKKMYLKPLREIPQLHLFVFNAFLLLKLPVRMTQNLQKSVFLLLLALGLLAVFAWVCPMSTAHAQNTLWFSPVCGYYISGMSGADHISAGRGEGENPRGGAKKHVKAPPQNVTKLPRARKGPQT